MKKVGLYFGSFNPIHLGHLVIANFIVKNHDFDEVWFVVSPQNPFKQSQNLAHENDRAEMVKLAIDGNEKLKLSTVEFDLPKPSYTIDTLHHLKNLNDGISFSIIMGEDNIMHLHKWKSYKEIIDNYPVYVYPRLSEGNYSAIKESDFPEEIKTGDYTLVDAPIIELSSTIIRKAIKEGNSIRYLVRDEVLEYINSEGLYS